MWPLLLLATLPLICVGISIPRACTPPHDHYPFCDPTRSLDERVDNLISLLTLEEKPYLLVARESPKGGIKRLGIPEYDWGGNCIHGVQSNCAPDGRCPTSFPAPNLLGASFNRTVWKAMGDVIGLEMRSLWLQNVGEWGHAKNLPHFGLDCWSPNINIVRDPRWGRNMETPSEDPLVCGEYGTQYTLGLQNGDDSRFLRGISTLKHFDANSVEGCDLSHPASGCKGWGPHGNITRHNDDAKISKYDLYSTYFPAFKATVQKGKAAGVMCSYNSINGIPSCANQWLLQTVLRDEWGFDGYVSSDSGAVDDVYNHHRYTRDWETTVAATLSAGCDVESHGWARDQVWSTGGWYIDYVPKIVRQGLIKEEVVDKALRNTLGLRFRLGLFDPIEDQPYWKVPPEVVHQQSHVDLAMDATRQGLVLLKNDASTLPFPLGSKVAVIGPHGNAKHVLLGNYLGQMCAGDLKNERLDCMLSVAQAITKWNQNGTVTYVKGMHNLTHGDPSELQHAMETAKEATHIVLMMGLDLPIEAEARDRGDINLPRAQKELVKAIAKLKKPTVMVLVHGGIVGIEGIEPQLPSIISAGYPGFFGGQGLADAIFGLRPQLWGNLAVTWYKSTIQDELDMLDFDMSTPPGRTHVYYTGKPLYQFGHGLRYTTFEHDLLTPPNGPLFMSKHAPTVPIKVRVTNTGSRDGDVVLFMYMYPAHDTIPAQVPSSKVIRKLVDFQRLPVIAPGASTHAVLNLEWDMWQMVTEDGSPIVYPGMYTLQIVIGEGKAIVVPVDVE